MYDAVYARQSLFKERSISIQTQIEMAEKACENPIKYYRDAGFSGGNTNRPEFQNMMKDIESGIINKVVVYRLDRISRSLLDFVSTWQRLKKKNVAFISVTENFDTTTPMGQAMLYIAAVFAELEREDIIVRVTDNYYSRAKLGYWLGGPAPYGYDLCLDEAAHKSILVPNENMDIVQGIFSEYINPCISLGKIAKELNKNNIPSPDPNATWNNVTLSRMLSNPLYIRADASVYSYYKELGVTMSNSVEEFLGENSCQLIGRNRRAKKFNELKLHLCKWEGVIESDIFIACQEKLIKNKKICNSGAGKYSWLSGLLKCGECGRALVVNRWKNVRREDVFAFTCSGRTKNSGCTAKTFPFKGEVEAEVQKEIEKLLAQCETVPVEKKKDPQLKIKLYKITEEIENLINVLKSSIPSDSMIALINNELEKLYSRQTALLEEQRKENVVTKLVKLDFASLGFEDKKKVAATYIDRVRVFAKPDRIIIEWKI